MPTPKTEETPVAVSSLADTLAIVRDDLLTARGNTSDEPTRAALWDAAAKVEAARRRAAAFAKKASK